MLPGLIEGHNHMFKVGTSRQPVQTLQMPGDTARHAVFSSIQHDPGCGECEVRPRVGLYHGARSVERQYGDVDLRHAINEGLIPGPRMQVARERMTG